MSAHIRKLFISRNTSLSGELLISVNERKVHKAGKSRFSTDFSEEAMSEDYVPYGAKIFSGEIGIEINYRFSFFSLGGSNLFEETWADHTPNMDLSSTISIEVI